MRTTDVSMVSPIYGRVHTEVSFSSSKNKYITDNIAQFIINNADEHAVFCVQRERFIRKLRAFNKQ